MFKLTPKNDKFYDFFDRAADLTCECAEELLNFLNNFENPEEHAKKIKDIEHEADKNVHATMELLHKSFIIFCTSASEFPAKVLRHFFGQMLRHFLHKCFGIFCTSASALCFLRACFGTSCTSAWACSP